MIANSSGPRDGMWTAGTIFLKSSDACVPLGLAALSFIGAQSLVAVPFGLLKKATSLAPFENASIAMALGLATFAACLMALRSRRPIAQAGRRRLSNITLQVVVVAVLVGLLARVLVIAFAVVTPASDAMVYMKLAERLASDEPYIIAGRFAYWPVGYPFLLSIWFRVFEPSIHVVHAFNVALYAATCLGILSLAKAWGHEQAGRLATILFACWPDLVVLTTWPSKELVAIALLPWAVTLCFAEPPSYGLRTVCRICAGLIVGCLVLVQPSFLLLIPILPLATSLAKRSNFGSTIREVTLVTVVAVLTVAPWTLRNYRVLNAFVPVATNGGEVFYRANNPLADGGYVKRGEVDLWVLPELEASRMGLLLAKEWITANPHKFIGLTFQKQLLFLEDDSIGVYEVFRRGNTATPIAEKTYFLVKLACIAYWYVLWVLFCGALYVTLRSGQWRRMSFVFAAVPFIFLYLIHSIFESGPRYHQPASALLVFVMAATLLTATSVFEPVMPTSPP